MPFIRQIAESLFAMTKSKTKADDAATRFYERSHTELSRRFGIDHSVEAAALAAGNHRYSAAYNYLRANPVQRVLEMGYGGNGIIKSLAPLAQRYDVVDIIDRLAGQPQPENLSLHIANLDNRFPFEDASFDVIVAMMVIEHLYDPFHAFSELARVAKPGAAIFINLPNIGSIRCRLELLRGRLPVTSTPDWFEQREWDGGHLHYFTVASVQRLALLSGLNVVGVEAVGSMPWLKRLRPSLLCHEITYRLTKPGL